MNASSTAPMDESLPAASLHDRLAQFKSEQGDVVRIDDIGEVVVNLLSSLQGDLTPHDLRVYSELEDLARYIYRAKQEINEIRPEDISAEHIPQASGELDAIGAHLEEATGNILDSVEAIETAAENLEGDAADQINDAVTRIYESCNFQDLAGQRITKIVSTLQNIETRIDMLLRAFGHQVSDDKSSIKNELEDNRTEDEKLLNGPALPSAATSQEDIDALFASFD